MEMEMEMAMEMAMEMEMRVKEDLDISQSLTPPLPPLSFALHDLFLHSHCSSCFSSLPSHGAIATPFIAYCSEKCLSLDSPLHFSSAEHHLFLHHGESTDLRVALRLLRSLELLDVLTAPVSARIAGLVTDRDDSARVRDGARAMAIARAMRDGREFDGNCEIEEAVMCVVVRNSVEVQIGEGKALGIGVYDGRFSWINHSCSPNACYGFLLRSVHLESYDDTSLRIRPANRGIQVEDDNVYDMTDLAEKCSSNGPLLMVRTIDTMRRGDEVTITYTDLVQPTKLRQADLLSKYHFLCNCRRCDGDLSYVDHSLQETLPHCSSARRDKFNEEMRDYFDNVISELTSPGISKNQSCCQKIEKMLTGGLSNLGFQLSPIHHLSLSAYTALYFGHKLETYGNFGNNSLKWSRLSTAYSLLLAGATHHLFISEPSLIASAAKHWTNAGESLVRFAKEWPSPLNLLTLSTIVCECENCLLMSEIKDEFYCFTPGHEALNNVSRRFLHCMTRIGPMVWRILSQSWYYLTQIEDPIDFMWLETLRSSNVWRGAMPSFYAREEDALTNEVRVNIFLLGAHCLVYGCCLSGVCYGEDSSIAADARSFLSDL